MLMCMYMLVKCLLPDARRKVNCSWPAHRYSDGTVYLKIILKMHVSMGNWSR